MGMGSMVTVTLADVVSDTIRSRSRFATNARLATSEAAEAVRNRMLQGLSTYKPRTFATHRPIFLANVVACTAKSAPLSQYLPLA